MSKVVQHSVSSFSITTHGPRHSSRFKLLFSPLHQPLSSRPLREHSTSNGRMPVSRLEIECRQFQETHMTGPRRSWRKSWATRILPTSDASKSFNWFPYKDEFDVGLSKKLSSSQVMELLDPFLMDTRKARIGQVTAQRTFQIVPVVEGLADLGNVSAVSRTAEALGMQSLHVISNLERKRYKDNRSISMGTDKWLDVELWPTTKECFQTLRDRGYRIVVTHLSEDTIPIYDIDWTIPTAVVFGNEHLGASEEALQESDLRISIPMAGMVDSFNISVAAGITLHHAVRDRIQRQGFHGDLTEEQQKILMADFAMRSNRHSKSVIEHLLSEKGATIGQSSSKALKFLNSVAEPSH